MYVLIFFLLWRYTISKWIEKSLNIPSHLGHLRNPQGDFIIHLIQLIQLLSSLVLALKLPVLVPKDPPLRVTFYFCIFRIYIFPEFVIHKAVSAYGD